MQIFSYLCRLKSKRTTVRERGKSSVAAPKVSLIFQGKCLEKFGPKD